VLNTQVDLDTSSADLPELSDSKKNLGFVIDIVRRVNSRQFVGTLLPGRAAKMQPRDPKLPQVEVVFATLKQKMELALDSQNTLLLAEVKSWSDDKPVAEIVQVIGKVDDLAAETKAILLQNNLDVAEYSQELIDTLPSSLDYKISDEEVGRRQDLRGRCIFTIDPLTAKDLDDALSCRTLDNGNFEVGVHISDVSHFLKEESDLDTIVKDKATSIYLANYVFHMLPRQLCMLCSLLPGADKLAFTVFFEMTAEGEVVATHFTKSVLNSCTQLAYEHAQDMIEHPEKEFDADDLPPIHHGYPAGEISRVVNQLHQLSLKLRAKRMAAGALKIDQPKLSFRLNPENGRPEGYCVYPIQDSNRMIEDFMLLANQTVADYIFKKFPNISVLRCHQPPNPQGIAKLKQFFAKHLMDFGIETSRDIQESIAGIVEGAENVEAAKAVVNVLASKPMTRARYFCSGVSEPEAETSGGGSEIPAMFSHYALSIPIYTHFTSPIRRYADVLVHRVLAAAIGCDEVPARDPDTLQALANRCNVQKYNAKIAGEESSALYFQHYVQSKKALRMKASVMGVYPYNLEVVLMETGDVVKVFYKVRPSKC
jgi:DIS3-like exonuclease 2